MSFNHPHALCLIASFAKQLILQLLPFHLEVYLFPPIYSLCCTRMAGTQKAMPGWPCMEGTVHLVYSTLGKFDGGWEEYRTENVTYPIEAEPMRGLLLHLLSKPPGVNEKVAG